MKHNLLVGCRLLHSGHLERARARASSEQEADNSHILEMPEANSSEVTFQDIFIYCFDKSFDEGSALVLY